MLNEQLGKIGFTSLATMISVWENQRVSVSWEQIYVTQKGFLLPVPLLSLEPGVEVLFLLHLTILCPVPGASSFASSFLFLISSALLWLRPRCFPCWRIILGFQLFFLPLDTCPPDILVVLELTHHLCLLPAPKPLSMACDPSHPIEPLSLALKTFLLSPNLTLGAYLQSYWHKTYILDNLVVL